MKNLDARLRRLVSSLDPERAEEGVALRGHYLRQKRITAATAAAADPALPEHLLTRVLVLLNQDTPPQAVPDVRWTRVAERTFTASVPLTRLADLSIRPEVRFIEAPRPMAPCLNTSLHETRVYHVHHLPPPSRGFKGDQVIVGIIDFGCDYTLDDFRTPDGKTRLEYLWDQSLDPQGGEQRPDGFGYGVEYNRATIDLALAPTTPDPFAVVRHKPDPGSHGTHVMGIAAGNGRSSDGQFAAETYTGVAPEATIIFVQPASVDGSRTLTDSTRIADAVAYIVGKARTLNLPCVINMSLGQNGGSHDGESVVERAIDRLLEEPGLAFVVAGGNEHTWREHASGVLQTGESRTLHWQVGGGLPLPGGQVLPNRPDRTANTMEIWYSSQAQFRVKLTDPAGNSVGPLEPGGNPIDQALSGGNQVFIDSERFTVLNGESRIFIEVSPGSTTEVKRGIWKVELEMIKGRNGRFDAWIERDLRDPANQFADQSFFAKDDFDPNGTLGTPATGRRSIAVANYDHHANPQSPASSSGRGRTRDGRDKPEMAAPGTGILSSHACGGRAVDPPGHGKHPMRLSMSGTSMAAPHVAGVIALLLQKNRRLSAAQIARILIAATRPLPDQKGFDVAWGYGVLDAQAAIEMA